MLRDIICNTLKLTVPPTMIPVCSLDTIANNTAKGYDFGDLSIFIVKKNDRIFIYKNSCPHLGIELNWQPDQFFDHEGMLIQCHTHGALFIPETGSCVAGPCMGQQLQPLPYCIDNNIIHIDLSAKEAIV